MIASIRLCWSASNLPTKDLHGRREAKFPHKAAGSPLTVSRTQKGLTGFVAARNAVVGRPVVFGAGLEDEVSLRDDEDRDTIVVDGNAFCYRIVKLHLDWTRGGEAATLKNVISSYIQAFTTAQLKVVFVWDGVFDTCKLDTVKGRLLQSIRNSTTYFRSSPSLRTHRGFRNESFLTPQLSLRTCIAHIRTIAADLDCDIEQHFPGGEADPYIANLAIERDAFILSQDSDFFITSHGSRGYIPLDSLQFVKISYPDANDVSDNGDWGQVTSSRKKQRKSGFDAAGSDSYTSIAEANQIYCKVYEATRLSKSLSLPSVAYLPLCAILAGNDYYTPPIWRSTGSPSAAISNGAASARRFDLVAESLVKNTRKLRGPIRNQMLPELMRKVIDDLREFAISDGQVSDIAQEALSNLGEYCTSSMPSGFLNPSRSGAETPLSAASTSILDSSAEGINPLHTLLLPAESETQQATQARLRVFNAFESGRFRNTLLQLIVYGTFTPTPILEDPDKASCIISCGRSIRTWIYAILGASIGIRRAGTGISASTEDERSDNDGQDRDSQEDPEGLQIPMEESHESSGSEDPVASATTVTEYVRRNATLSQEEVMVPNWESLDAFQPEKISSKLPPLSRSTIERYHILLQATSSCTKRLMSTSGIHVPVVSIVTSLRHLAFTFEDTAHAWSRSERRAALTLSLILLQAYDGHSGAQDLVAKPQDPTVPIVNEHIQRAAQLTTTILSVALLAECLLLTPLLSKSPETLYQGSLFYELLELSVRSDGAASHSAYWEQAGISETHVSELVDMMEEGLPQMEEPKVKAKAKKKDKTEKNATASMSPSSGKSSTGGRAQAPLNKFAMLAL